MAITMLLRSDALRAEFDGVVAVALGHLGPWAVGPKPPEDAVQNPTIIYTGNPTRLVQQQRLDDRNFVSVSSYRRCLIQLLSQWRA